MIGINKITNPKILTILISVLFAFSSIFAGSAANIDYNDDVNRDVFDDFDWQNGIPDINNIDVNDLDSNSAYPENFDVGQFLSDNENKYQQVWDPWVSKAAIHAVATYNDGDMLALAGGYLYDNQIHLYRWNYAEDRYDLVWEIGGGVFQSDVTSLAFADTDYNNLTEIIAGGEDGVLYVFEQKFLYDPYTNMENEFELVWKSPRLGRIFDVLVFDSDQDFRQDIIVGTGDTVRWFEYDTHGSYPFGPDHFIEYREVFSLQMPSQVTSLGISDVNSNGLKEVAAGLRSGEVHLLENDGETLMINGQPYPIVQDNAYVDIWNSGNIVRRPISDMEGGDLDQDGEMELLIAVQGQGAYVLDTIDGTFGLFRIQRDFAKWETNPIEIYPLDVYTDAMINSSSWFNNTDLSKLQSNVYYQNATSFWPEPLNYTEYGNFIIYPYSSYSVMNQQPQPDGRYTTFWAGKLTAFYDTAWAVYDWGNDEEAAGNGISSLPDVKIYVESTNVADDQLNISISQDNVHWFNVNNSYVKNDSSGKFYTVEVDPAMGEADINYYRYIRLEVLSGLLKVDVLETLSWNNPIYDALSVETGFMTFKSEETPTPVGYIGTIDGAILAVTWDAVERKYVIRWDSWNDERWKLKTNIFDLEVIKQTGRFPGWIDRGFASDTLDLSGNLPDGGTVASWTAENFYNSRNENFLEYVVISSTGKIYVYQQTSPYTTPLLNPQLTEMLFGNTIFPRTVGPSTSWGVQQWLYDLKANGIDYFTMSILPIDVTVSTAYGEKFDPYSNGFMLYLGSWDGSMGNLDQGNSQTVTRGEIDVSLWYLKNEVTVDTTQDPGNCGAYSLPVCSYFQPLRQTNNFNLFYDANASFQKLATLSTQELTGQMWGTFSASTWMPKVAAADFIAGPNNDYIVTNGKLTLMEAQFGFGSTQSTEPEFIWGESLPAQAFILSQASSVLSEFSFVTKGGYFDEINAKSKGRQWSNANPVDFDGDGDMDLILGFATYSTPFFGMDKVTFGATYWENQGSREVPKWVELPLAITNTDIDSGFRAQNYTDPLFIYDEYDMDKVRSSPLGYHPSFRTSRPKRLLMWQPIDHTNIFSGRIRTFFAEYNLPSSLLAATYPEAKRIDINLQYVDNGGYDTEINYGFHVFETWDNSAELNEWTMSLSTADLDQDGKNEIIVGDFNNNIYVFEHLSNNTYKRAFKSFDVNRTIQTDQSPYAYEQFEGLSGTFNRTLFDHVKYLIAGMDLNNNSRQEFIAATENMVFVFEATTSPTGRIMDDTYKLIKIIDLLDFPTLSGQDIDQTKISAMTWADDLTKDGRRELIIAVTSGLLVLEVDKAPTPKYKESGEFVTEEIFFGDSYNLMGLYDLPGNYFVHPELVIEAVLVEDLDSDGFLDLAVGGTDTSGARPLYSGFLTIMEWRGSGFRLLEEEGQFDDMLKFNPVNDLAVDDTDFDGFKELLVAHAKGIDIYEFTGDDTIELMEIITSNPSYRFPDRSYNLLTSNLASAQKDVIRSPDGTTLIMVYSDANVLYYTTSTDEGKTWAATDVFRYAGGGTINGDLPSLTIGYGGIVWLSYIRRTIGVNNIRYDMYLIRDINPGGTNLEKTIEYDTVYQGSLSNTPTPRLFNIAGNLDTNKIGFVYAAHQKISNLNNAMRFLKLDITRANYDLSEAEYYADWANTTIIPNNFAVHSLDITQLNGNSRKYGVVFAGYPFGESKSLDLDLFYDEIYLNDTGNWLFNVTTPNRIYASGMAARNPSIIQELDTGNLLVTYEEPTLRPYGGLWAVWSNDRGYNWNGPYDMSYPLGLDMPLLVEALPTKSRESYVITTSIGFEAITDFASRIPVIVPGNNRGFTMVYNVRIEFQIDIRDLQGASADKKGSRVGLCGQQGSGSVLADHKTNYNENVGCKRKINLNVMASAINPWSNFTWYELGAANKIVIGDTDRDGRHEILVSSGKQAFLFEFASNSQTFILHEQKWKSDLYERDITGIAISDANGNGFPEIILESDRGIVQTFEVINMQQNSGNLIYSKEETLINSPLAAVDNSVVKIIAADLNLDGTEDFVYATLGGWLIAIDGTDYSELWSQVYVSTPTPLYQHTKDLEIQLAITRNTLTGNPIAVILSNNAELTRYRASDGFKDYSILLGGSSEESIGVLRVADVITGGSEEILIGLFNGTVSLISATDLSIIWSVDLNLGLGIIDSNDPTDIRVASFTNANVIEVVVMNLQGDVTVLTGSTGATVWQTHVPINTKNVGLAILDSNGDSKPDIVITQNATFALNGLDGGQLWNASSYSGSNSFSRALILETNNIASANEVRNILQAIDIPSDIMNVVSQIPSVEELLQYGIVVSVSGIASSNPSILGDNLADYLDQGGKFITFAYSYVPPFAITGRLQTDAYLPMTAVTNDNIPRDYDGLSNNPALSGVSSFSAQYSMDVSIVSGSNVIASYIGGMAMVAIKGNAMVINSYFTGASGDVGLLVQNSVSYVLQNQIVVQDPIIFDADEDGVNDIIYTTYYRTGEYSLFAISGRNGNLLWTYSPSVPGMDRFSGAAKLITLDDRNVLIFQDANSVTTDSGLTILVDPHTGIAIGGIQNSVSGIALEVSNLSYSNPLVIVGDSLGNITIHSLWKGQPLVTADPIPELTQQPFFRLGSEFTRRTEYLMYDFIQAPGQPSINDGDGIDDVIVIDDFYIGAGDTYRLLEDPLFNEANWTIQTSDIDMGRYLGGAKIGNIDADSGMELVAPFENYLLAIDIETGNIEWKYEHWIGDDYNTIREFEFQLVNLDADSQLEILYSRFFWYFGWPISQLTSLDGDGGSATVIKNQFLPFGKDLVFNVGDIDGVGTSTEIILAVKYFFNPSIAILAVFDNNFGLKDGVAPVILNGMFPITEIAVGDFDETTTGEEFIYFFEMAELNLPEIIYNLIGFPTLFIQFGWNNAFNSNYTIPLDFDNIIGIAPTGEPTANYWVEVAKDVDGTAGNDITYLVIESRTGDLFNYDFSTSGVLMTHTGIIRDSAIPYAKTSFVTGTFEGCGTNSFITLTAANSISCYYNNDGSLNFTSPIEAWSRTLEFDVIQDMVVADLDDDGIDDLLIASFSGYVWVTRSNPPPQPLLQLSGQNEISPVSSNSDRSEILSKKNILLVSIGTSSLTGLLIILKKKKILPT